MLRVDHDGEAEPLQDTLARVTERIGAFGGASAFLGVSDVLLERGDSARSEVLLAFGDQCCEEGGGQLVSLRVERAHLAIERGAFDEGLQRLDEAEQAHERVQDPRWKLEGRFEILARRLDALLALGLADVAAPLVEEEKALAVELGAVQSAVAAYHRGQFLVAAQRYRQAAECVEAHLGADPTPVDGHLRLVRATALFEQSLVDSALGEQALEALDEARHDPDPRLARKAELRWADACVVAGRLDAGRAAVARSADALARGALPFEDELFTAELLGRIALVAHGPDADPGALATARTTLEAAFERFRAVWRSVPRRPGGVSFLTYGTRRRALVTLVRLHLALDPGPDGERRALEAIHAIQCLGQTVRFSDVDPGTLDECLRRLTADGGGVLLYLPGRQETHLFTVDARQRIHTEIGTPGVLEARGREWCQRVLAGEAAEPATVARGRALVDVLLPPAVRSRLREWRHVTVIGAELLGSVPFEALPLDDTTLGERVAVSHLASLPMAGWLAAARGHAVPAAASSSDSPELVLVAAPAVASDDFAPIQLDGEDRARLLAPFAAGRARVLDGPHATRHALSSGALTGASGLVFFTHGVQRPGTERPAALVLCRDGQPDYLDAAAIEALEVPPLVVVCACGAARGPIRRGDDFQHLGGAFLAAGSRAVVVSPAEIEVTVARDLAAVFLERVYIHGDAPAEALRRARVAVGLDPGRTLVQLHGLGGDPLELR